MFVLSYFMGDGSLSIFEPPQRNSGLPGGKFLERMKVRCCRITVHLDPELHHAAQARASAESQQETSPTCPYAAALNCHHLYVLCDGA